MGTFNIIVFIVFTALVALLSWLWTRDTDTGSGKGYYLGGRTLTAPVIVALGMTDVFQATRLRTLDTLTRRVSRLQVRLQTADAEEATQAFITRIAADLSDISNLLTARYLLSAPDGVREGRAPE